MSSSRVGSSISTTHSAAASPSLLASGIFATEPGQRLLLILEAFADRGFLGLYKKCAGNTEGDYYQTGLRRVHMWSNEVVEEDISHIRARCPDLDETYEACFVQYVGDRYRGRRRPTVQCPPVHEFARRFLESFGQHSSVCAGDFFTQRGDMLLRRMVCMDAARQALYAVVTTENVRIELASEVSAAAAPRRLADATSEDLKARARPSPPLQSSPPSEIAPQDSISQVGVRRQEERDDYNEERQSVVSARPVRAESQGVGRREDTSKRSSSSTRERSAPSEVMDGRSVVAPSAVAPSAIARSVARDLPPPTETVRAPPSHVSVSSSVRRRTSAPSPPHRSPSPPHRSPSPSPPPESSSSPPPSPRYEEEDRRHKVHEYDDRHNFALSRDIAEEEEEPVVVARPPKRMEEFTGTSRISSRDSSVSIGMKKARSPRQ